MIQRYKNKKNGNYYRVIGEVTNATNKQNGEIMIYYTDEVQSFVREKIEFYEKFEVVIK
jgi:hypothetical protein